MAVMAAMKVLFSGFSAFFELLRVVPELSASFSEPSLDEKFFVVKGSPANLAQDFVDVHISSLQPVSETTTTLIQSGEAPF